MATTADLPDRYGATDDADPDSVRLARQAWELTEEVTELRTRLAEQAEMDAIRELEVAALRRDVELRAARIAMLEAVAEERRGHLESLQAAADKQAARVRRLRKRAIRARKVTMRERKAGRLAQEELAIERGRISHQLLTGRLERLTQHRVLWAIAHRLAARIARRQTR